MENKTGRGIEPIGKDFGDNPKPVNLFIWEFGGGLEGGKGSSLSVTHPQDLLVLQHQAGCRGAVELDSW